MCTYILVHIIQVETRCKKYSDSLSFIDKRQKLFCSLLTKIIVTDNINGAIERSKRIFVCACDVTVSPRERGRAERKKGKRERDARGTRVLRARVTRM